MPPKAPLEEVVINALFLVAWAGVLCFAGLICLGIWKAFRIWLESRSFEDQARQIHNQSAQMLMKEHSRRQR